MWRRFASSNGRAVEKKQRGEARAERTRKRQIESERPWRTAGPKGQGFPAQTLNVPGAAPASCGVQPGIDMAHPDIVEKARAFAVANHDGQEGKRPHELYIQHIHNVVELLGQTTPEVVAAAYLHDCLEKTDTTIVELLREFGEVGLAARARADGSQAYQARGHHRMVSRSCSGGLFCVMRPHMRDM
jgi:hypothetical protein